MRKCDEEKIMASKKKIRRRTALIAAAAAFILLALVALDCRLIVRNYEIEAEAIDTPLRIALITDLHSCKYGEGQNKLIRAVDAQLPDIILLGGDIIDDDMPDDNADIFLAGIAGRYPCYYVTGNHEYWSGKDGFAAKTAILEKHGVEMLSGESVIFEAGGSKLMICGADDSDAFMIDENFDHEAQLAMLGEAAEGAEYSLLLSHRPEYFDLYSGYDFDLVLSGHAHGGQFRFWDRGVYAPGQGLFPKYTHGRYGNMIVSAGLANTLTPLIPRIGNPCEIVDLHFLPAED
jgi:predicted MPP superfamily phosphohydrolase